MGLAIPQNFVRICVIAFLFAVATHPLLGQDDTPVFEKLAGEWIGNGTLMGRTAGFTMTWESHDGFAVLKFTNAFVNANREVTPVLNSVAVYRTSVAQPEAIWLDSRPQRIEIQWEVTDSTLTSHWTAASETGRTVYRVVSADEVEVVDEVESNDTWRVFATARYTRVETN